MPIVDIHAHFVPPGLERHAERSGDPRWPTLVRDHAGARIVQAGRVYRQVDDGYDDVGVRLAQMDQLGIDVQVLSSLPVMLPYWADPAPAREFCRAFNESLASVCAAHPDRFRGLGTVPMQDVDGAITELDRVRSLGLVGVEVGTWLGGSAQLTDRATIDVFAAAAGLDLPILLHPNAPQTFGTPTTPTLELGVGVGCESARALASLHLAGALHSCDGLRMCASHGGGAFLWLWPRLRQLAQRAGAPDTLAPALWVDTVGLDRHNLTYVEANLGTARMLFGTDLPAAGIAWSEDLMAALRARPESVAMFSANAHRFLAKSVASSDRARPG